jgi:hypothetical protein
MISNLMFVALIVGGLTLFFSGVAAVYPPAALVLGGLALLRVASAVAKDGEG